MIILNIIVLALETVESINSQYQLLFNYFDNFSMGAFLIEYILRIWSCNSIAPYNKHFLKGRLNYAVKFLPLMDLLAILPMLMPLIGLDLRFTRAARLFRLFRIGKMVRYISTFKLLSKVLERKKTELLSSLVVLMFFLMISSCLMYHAEHIAQPEKFSSIPASMWWAIVTLTTVGYGDTYPITPLGKFVGSFIAIIGIFTFALPTAILGAAFVEETDRKSRKKVTCPKCGNNFLEERRKP